MSGQLSAVGASGSAHAPFKRYVAFDQSRWRR